jgi:hypothetical protein
MSNRIAVAKSGKNALTATDPNDFIYHSDYNTFKILSTGLYEPTVAANTTTTYTIAHNLETIPVVYAFLRQDTVDAVVTPNNFINNVSGLNYYLAIETLGADYQNIRITVSNDDSSSHVAHIRYWLLEAPL